ncbi:unnamed protein product [Fusarium graminearum]|uniref:Chromosome 3, complete genome n=2 Tax=Gibberella zeae TaxID=5518 RepID=A0A098DYV3_GIBZE|nr:hypothetical protein HG531_003916 [Fusarium graminearum]CAF3473601.1 unnamed protein product [Fusarium graminearum]CAF3537606.1 unnamed protein product [Fusarium graminearum]CAF3570316.1 unnamed protein product [Fusarium graminearum]CAG1962439.1 unnamed protein product [Fusarium graminearum]
MRTVSSVLAFLLAGGFVSASYTVEIPEDAIWVTSWDQLHEMAAKYQDTALEPKYGGNVIEVDGKIVLATDDKITKEIDDLVQQLEKNDPEAKEEPKISKRRDLNVLEPRRRCSHPDYHPAGEGYVSRIGD